MINKFYVTTPIYYVNDSPHIGSSCTTLIADILNRYHQLIGDSTYFITGTDEHGAKVAEAAAKAGQTPQKFCDSVSKKYLETWPKLDIRYDYFIRTTNPGHKKNVQEILNTIYQKGDIYKSQYEGLYCIGCEKFITETELVEGKCPLHPNREIVHQSEENYFFKLSSYIPTLIEAIENDNHPHHYEIYPDSKRNEILSRLKAGVNDLSISRAQVSWGIPVPWDHQQTIYVWVEALFNYYTALKINNKLDFWPASVHVIGKEISWFHSVIWEALLLSAGLNLPKKIFVHSFYTIDGQKMSKSIGNVITPQQLIDRYGVDGSRFLIASSFPTFEDSDVSWQKFDERYNADLANGLGNLVARVIKLCDRVNLPGKTQPATFLPEISEKINLFRFSEALEVIQRRISDEDKRINENKPWRMENEPLIRFLEQSVANIYSIAYNLLPFMPSTAEEIISALSSGKIKPIKALFPRIGDHG